MGYRPLMLFSVFSLGVLFTPHGWGEEETEKKVKAFIEEYEKGMAGRGKGGKFGGLRECKGCHAVKKIGKQFPIWRDTRHAKAFESLSTDRAKEYAKAKGIEDPQADARCLQCHSPVANVKKQFKSKKADPADGVICESCHGPGEKHAQLQKKARTIKKDIPESLTVLIKADDPAVKQALCERCHKENEYHELPPFDLEKAWKKIEHMKPEGYSQF